MDYTERTRVWDAKLADFTARYGDSVTELPMTDADFDAYGPFRPAPVDGRDAMYGPLGLHRCPLCFLGSTFESTWPFCYDCPGGLSTLVTEAREIAGLHYDRTHGTLTPADAAHWERWHQVGDSALDADDLASGEASPGTPLRCWWCDHPDQVEIAYAVNYGPDGLFA